MYTLTYLMIGLALAVFLIFLNRKLFPKREMDIWRLGLVIAAVVYVVFALVGGANDYLPLEASGVILYGIFAWLSLKHNLLWLALGWALHIAWDVWLHSGDVITFVPIGYPVMCIGFDIAIAAYIAWRIWNGRLSESN